MLLHKWLIVMGGSTLLSAGALAQEDAAFPGAEAQTAMRALAPLAGEWVAEVYARTPEGDWQSRGHERVSIQFMLNDLALRDAAPEHSLNGWRLESTIQYDMNRDVFRQVAIDDTWGNMDIYEGDWSEENVLVMTNLRSDTSYVGEDGSSLHFRLTTRIQDFHRNEFLVEMTSDRGETWQPYQRIIRHRLGSAG